MTQLDNEDAELLGESCVEAADLLEETDESFVELEGDPSSINVVNTLLDCWRRGADCCVLKGSGLTERLQSAVEQSVSSTRKWESSIDTVRKGSRGGDC